MDNIDETANVFTEDIYDNVNHIFNHGSVSVLNNELNTEYLVKIWRFTNF